MKIALALYNNKKIPIIGYNNLLYNASSIANDLIELIDNIENIDSNKIKHLDQLDESDIEFLPPLELTNKIICTGLNYKDHAKETQKEEPKYPIFFARFPSSIVGHKQNIIKSSKSNKFDFEAELAIIIGKKCKNVTKEEASKYIAGFSIFNDVTARDYQGRSSQWLLGKNFDKSGSMGPFIIPKNQIQDYNNLSIQTFLNGKVMQDGNTADMIFSCESLIEHITESLTLESGDVIITGTPAGVGYVRNPPIYLQDGDVIEVEIKSIGKLTNNIEQE